MNGMGDFPDILALGDSWFFYPANNLLIPIWNFWAGNRVIFAQGVVGAEAVELAQGKWLKKYKKALNDYKGTLEAVLISAGGNDFAGMDDMSRILQNDCSNAATGEECYDRPELQRLLFDEVRGAYRVLIREAQQRVPGAHIFVHNYDYAIPTGQGFGGFGDWLKAPMDLALVPAALQPAAVNYLIDSFSDVLAMLQGEFPDIVVVDSTGVLQPGDWANELHPSMGGFNKIANQAWMAPMMARLP